MIPPIGGCRVSAGVAGIEKMPIKMTPTHRTAERAPLTWADPGSSGGGLIGIDAYVIVSGASPPWACLTPGTWATRFWLRGFVSGGGHVPPDEFTRLWGDA
jgi:hypothetical protein